MKGDYLGEFEELVLLIVASLADGAYAVSVKEAVESVAMRSVNISAIHSSLYRLEDKGFLKSTVGGATETRGGKSKRYFRPTSSGFKVLRESKSIKERIWKTIPQLSVSKS